MEMETFAPLLKPSKGFEELKKSVIDTGMCSGCGACAAFCERIEMQEGMPVLAKDCNLKVGAIKCSLEGNCYDNCPHVSFSWKALEEGAFGGTGEDPVLGHYMKILGVRSKKKEVLEKAQDGGAVTSLLLCALENGLLDGAVVAARSGDWKTSPEIVTKKEELLGGAGTKYARTPTPMKFGRSLRGARKLGMVGTGCQTTAARRFQSTVLKYALEKTRTSDRPLNLLLIGLFCFENFPYAGLKKVVEGEFKVPFADVAKTDITKGKFIITKMDGSTDKRPVKLFNDLVPEACRICTNFTSRLADISVGSVGTEPGWSTVIVRSKKGMELVKAAEEMGYIEVTEKADPAEVKKTDSFKDEKRKETREKREKEGSYIPRYE